MLVQINNRISITQFTLNFLYHQKRYEKIYSAVILNLIEITAIIFLVTFLENPTYRFENLFLIYLIIIFLAALIDLEVLI